MIGVTALHVLRFLRDYQDEHGEPPTLSQIDKEVGLRARATSWQHCQNWLRDGFVEARDTMGRKYRITTQGRQLLELYQQ